MLSVIATSAKRKHDELDVEFDSVTKADQLNRGIRYNGLSLVGKQPVAAPPAPAQKRGMRQFLEQIIFGETAS